MEAPTAADFDRLAALRHEDFADRTGDSFEVVGLDDPFVLAAVVDLQREGAPTRERHPFSLVFHHPARLPQRIYVVEHPTLDRLPLFLVPVGRSGDVYEYEAVFQ